LVFREGYLDNWYCKNSRHLNYLETDRTFRCSNQT